MTTRSAVIIVRDSAVGDALEIILEASGVRTAQISLADAIGDSILVDDTILVADERLIRPAAAWVADRRAATWGGLAVLLVEDSGSEDLRPPPPPAAWLSKPFSAKDLIDLIETVGPA